MAALVDTNMPEITRQISREVLLDGSRPEMVEPDVIVKSKPRPVVVAHMVQQNGEVEEREEDIEPDVIVRSKPWTVDLFEKRDPSSGTMERSQKDPGNSGQTRSHREQPQTLLSPTTTTGAVGQRSTDVGQKRANGDVGRSMSTNKEKVAPSLAVAQTIDQISVKREEEFDDSTAMLLRRYTGSKDGQDVQIPITSTGVIGGTVSLTETFRVGGRSCMVRLEEDYISWIPNGKRDGKSVDKPARRVDP